MHYYAAMLSSINKGTYIVPGTSNKCELYVGYFTKGGDNVSDIQVLPDLTVDEVIQVGEYIGVPNEVVHEPPADGLSGKTDEEKLGVKYSEIAEVISNPKNPNVSKEAHEKNVSKEAHEKIKKLHLNNLHKFNVATYRKGK